MSPFFYLLALTLSDIADPPNNNEYQQRKLVNPLASNTILLSPS